MTHPVLSNFKDLLNDLENLVESDIEISADDLLNTPLNFDGVARDILSYWTAIDHARDQIDRLEKEAVLSNEDITNLISDLHTIMATSLVLSAGKVARTPL